MGGEGAHRVGQRGGEIVTSMYRFGLEVASLLPADFYYA